MLCAQDLAKHDVTTHTADHVTQTYAAAILLVFATVGLCLCLTSPQWITEYLPVDGRQFKLLQ